MSKRLYNIKSVKLYDEVGSNLATWVVKCWNIKSKLRNNNSLKPFSTLHFSNDVLCNQQQTIHNLWNKSMAGFADGGST